MKLLKKNFGALCACLLMTCAAGSLLSACGSLPVAQQSGKDDTCLLLFVSESAYKGAEVNVQLDETEFVAKAVSVKKAQRKGTTYGVQPGARSLTVKDANGKVIYSKKVFLSAQETKKIVLP